MGNNYKNLDRNWRGKQCFRIISWKITMMEVRELASLEIVKTVVSFYFAKESCISVSPMSVGETVYTRSLSLRRGWKKRRE